MTQLLSLAKELLKWIQNQRLKWKNNQTIITTDFTQICSPSQVWSFKKILNTVFTPVPPKAVLSKCAGSQMTKTGLVPIVLNRSISLGAPGRQ